MINIPLFVAGFPILGCRISEPSKVFKSGRVFTTETCKRFGKQISIYNGYSNDGYSMMAFSVKIQKMIILEFSLFCPTPDVILKRMCSKF